MCMHLSQLESTGGTVDTESTEDSAIENGTNNDESITEATALENGPFYLFIDGTRDLQPENNEEDLSKENESSMINND